MVIDLFQLSEPEHSFDAEIQPAEIDLDDESARLEKPVKIAGRLRKGIAQTDVEGRIGAELEMECTRCLSPSAASLDVPFKVAYVTEENYTSAEEAELRGEELGVAIFDGERIDLAELAREQILLNLPVRFLCREDCRGLCPKCGADRNTVNCNCEEGETDPRWSALKELKRNS